jgi:hypothetical protein
MSNFAKFGSTLLKIERFVSIKSNLTGQAFLSAFANILTTLRAEIIDIDLYISKGKITPKYDIKVTSLLWLEQRIEILLKPITKIYKKLQTFKFLDQFESGGNVFSCELIQFCFGCCEESRDDLFKLWKFVFIYTFQPFMTIISNMFKTGIVDPFDEFMFYYCESVVEKSNKWDQVVMRRVPTFLEIFINDLLLCYKSVLVLDITVKLI